MSIEEYRGPLNNMEDKERIKEMLDLKITVVKEDDSMSAEAIKKKLEDFRIEWEASRGCTDMTDFSDDVEYLLEQNNQLREERDSFQRVGIKVQEVNVRLVEALEEIKRNTKYLQHVPEHGKNFDIADSAIQAYKLLEKKEE